MNLTAGKTTGYACHFPQFALCNLKTAMTGCFLIIALQKVADLFLNKYSINIPATLLLAKRQATFANFFSD